MNIILISGKAQHGKDTCALFMKKICEEYGKRVLITHYGDLVKYSCGSFFDWDGIKNEAGRSLLQKVGTDIVRAAYPDYWVEYVMNMIKFSMTENLWDVVIIPDVRFPNEIDIDHYFYDLKPSKRPYVTAVRVEREKDNKLGWKSPLTHEQQNHPSETALDLWRFYYKIFNDSDLKSLEAKCCTVTDMARITD